MLIFIDKIIPFPDVYASYSSGIVFVYCSTWAQRYNIIFKSGKAIKQKNAPGGRAFFLWFTRDFLYFTMVTLPVCSFIGKPINWNFQI